MATVHSAYSSSPICYDMMFDDLSSGQLFPDLGLDWSMSIHADVQKLEADMDFTSSSSISSDSEPIQKAEIRNGDCMWSGSAGLLSTSASSTGSDVIASRAVPPTAINIKQEPIVVVANNSKMLLARNQQQYAERKTDIKLEPSDDYEQQLQQHSIPNSRGAQQQQPQQQQTLTQQTQSMQHIPPGTSLLRRSNVQQQKRLQRLNGNNGTTRPQLTTAAIADTNNNSNSLCYARPDTPHSLDDEIAVETKYDVDLRACVMGSNNIALTTDASSFIDNVSKELQDTSKNHIHTRLVNDYELSEVMDVIVKDESTMLSHESSSAASSMTRSSDSDSEDEESYPIGDLPYGRTSPVPSQASSAASSQHNPPSYYHSDHSYTRNNDGIDDLGTIDTPSDSDEEIDVVSIGDKKLPTNPSDRDRRAIQTKVAYKFTAHIVKTANGLRTIPPRRRYNMPYTPASSSPVKSVTNSRYPSPASTPYQSTQQMMTVLSSNATVISEKSRKRVTAAAAADIIDGGEHGTWLPSKKHRGKKPKHHGSFTAIGSAGLLKRHNTIDEMDTIEKRNLHNDMERQRRIGLKNLFEELKKQIPSIKDKERAPKVNILREAAKLCEALTREDQLLCEKKAALKELLRKRQEQLARLRSLQRD